MNKDFGKGSVYNLQLTPATLKRLPWEKAVPYNSDQILIVVSPTIAFGIFELTNEKSEEFSIKSFMQTNQKVFGEESFRDRLSAFASLFEARIERYYITKKSPYLFFDAEEQQFIRMTFSKFKPTAYMEIFMREDQTKEFERKEMVDLDIKEFRQVYPYIKRMNPQVISNFERFYVQFRHYEQTRLDKMLELRKRNEEKFMEEMTARYPFLQSIENQKGFKSKYRDLAKKYHPDTGGDEEIFSQISADFSEIEKTMWFASMEGSPMKTKVAERVFKFFKGGDEEDEPTSEEG